MCCSLINLMPTRPSMKGTYFQMLTVVFCFHMEQKKIKIKPLIRIQSTTTCATSEQLLLVI